MCVIVVSEKGIKQPTKEMLKSMWDKNRDGAGILVDSGTGEIEYTKGYMTWEAFEKGYDDYASKYNLDDVTLAIHFRITTRGNTDSHTTHPFLLSPRYEDLRLTHYKGRVPAMMHNGTITGFGGMLDKQSSDTQDYAGTIGYAMLRKSKSGRKPNKAMIKATATTIDGSRVVVFYGDGEPVYAGPWKQDGDLKVSNTFYQSGLNCKTAGVCAPSTVSTTNTFTTPTQSVTKPDAVNSQWFQSTIHWIKYTSEKVYQEAAKYYSEKVKQDKDITIIKSTAGVEKLVATVDTIEGKEYHVFTEKGWTDSKVHFMEYKRKAQTEIEYFIENYNSEYDELDDWDYVFDTDPNFYKLFTGSSMSELVAPDGRKMYYDEFEGLAMSEKALKDTYGENWRNARQDIIINGKTTINWEAPTQTQLKKFKELTKSFYVALNEV